MSQFDQRSRRYLLRCTQLKVAGHGLQLMVMFTLAILATGCDQGPRVGEVTGAISYKGKPMGGIEITFDPVTTGRRSSSVTDSSGRYELHYTRQHEGALVGEHQVRLVWPVQNEADLMQRKKYPIPSSYNTETTLAFNVKQGKNVFDLDIRVK